MVLILFKVLRCLAIEVWIYFMSSGDRHLVAIRRLRPSKGEALSAEPLSARPLLLAKGDFNSLPPFSNLGWELFELGSAAGQGPGWLSIRAKYPVHGEVVEVHRRRHRVTAASVPNQDL